jgi:hypothetical protein
MFPPLTTAASLVPSLEEAMRYHFFVAPTDVSSVQVKEAFVGAAFTTFLHGQPAKGLLVLYATFAYGCFAFLLGVTKILPVGCVAVFMLAAADGVGMNLRQQLTLSTSPEEMQGRASSLCSVAAQTANSLGVVWVSMLSATTLGPGGTEVLGGCLTILLTSLVALLMPELRTYRSS